MTTAAGAQTTPSRLARRREAEYIANFQQQFHPGRVLTHPVTWEVIRLADWSAVARMEDETFRVEHYRQHTGTSPTQQWSYPINVRLCYWIEPKSLGFFWRRHPKQALVIECAAYSRLDQFVIAGHDNAHLGRDALEALLQERQTMVQRWSARYGAPVAYVVGLASTTGWDAESISALQDFAYQSGLLPYLVDLAALKLHHATDEAHHKQAVGQYAELFELPLGEQKVKQIAAQIKDLLLTTGASRFTDLQAEITCSQGLLRTACARLVQSNPDYRILQEGTTLIIRAD